MLRETKVGTGLRKESASIEEAHASCVEVSTPVTYYKINSLPLSFLRRKLVLQSLKA